MKTLLLLRHAKSSWKDSGVEDHERRLKRRGKKQSRKIGRALAEENLLPDLLVASTAKRCRKTAGQVIDASGYRGESRVTGELYEADGTRLREYVSKLDGSAGRVLLIGHNPGMEEFLAALVGEPTALGTATMAQVDLPIERWSDLNDSTRGTLVKVWQPGEL